METGEEAREVMSIDALATPEKLSHFYILLPPKLRLVTLAAFILSKCRVSSFFISSLRNKNHQEKLKEDEM